MSRQQLVASIPSMTVDNFVSYINTLSLTEAESPIFQIQIEIFFKTRNSLNALYDVLNGLEVKNWCLLGKLIHDIIHQNAGREKSALFYILDNLQAGKSVALLKMLG